MLWQAPWAFWLALSLPAIAALYMLRRRRPRRAVPSLLLWRSLPQQKQVNTPWQRLRPQLLLWLQLLAALLLVLAAARPLWPGGARLTGTHYILLLDASLSMQAVDGAHSRFARAQDAILDLASALGPDERLSLIRLDDRPHVLLNEGREGAAVRRALAGQEPGYAEADLTAGLALAKALTGDGERTEWVLFSDGIVAAAQKPAAGAGVAFRHVQVGLPAGNVALAALSLRAGPTGPSAQVTVENHGGAATTGQVVLYAAEQSLGSRPFAAAAGERAYLSWPDLPAAAWYRAELRQVDAAANALAADDVAWAVPAAPAGAKVLLVSEGNSFFTRALAVHEEISAYRLDPADYAAVTAGDFDLIIFDRWQPAAWPPGNALLWGPPAGGDLLDVGDSFTPRRVAPHAEHPLLRHVRWQEVYVAQARTLALPAPWTAVVDSADGPLLAVAENDGVRRAVAAFALHESDLALRPAFPVLMANLLEWLAPAPLRLAGDLRPGAVLAPAAPPTVSALWLESPAGERAELVPPWPPRPYRITAPGVHRLVQQRGETGAATLFAVNAYQPDAADLRPRTVELPLPAAAAPGGGRPQPLWPALILAVLLLSLCEWWVDARGR